MMTLNRRHALGSLAALTLIAKYGPARAAKPFTAPAALVDAAKKEGELVLYTAAFPEVMQDTSPCSTSGFPASRSAWSAPPAAS